MPRKVVTAATGALFAIVVIVCLLLMLCFSLYRLH